LAWACGLALFGLGVRAGVLAGLSQLVRALVACYGLRSSCGVWMRVAACGGILLACAYGVRAGSLRHLGATCGNLYGLYRLRSSCGLGRAWAGVPDGLVLGLYI